MSVRWKLWLGFLGFWVVFDTTFGVIDWWNGQLGWSLFQFANALLMVFLIRFNYGLYLRKQEHKRTMEKLARNSDYGRSQWPDTWKDHRSHGSW